MKNDGWLSSMLLDAERYKARILVLLYMDTSDHCMGSRLLGMLKQVATELDILDFEGKSRHAAVLDTKSGGSIMITSYDPELFRSVTANQIWLDEAIPPGTEATEAVEASRKAVEPLPGVVPLKSFDTKWLGN